MTRPDFPTALIADDEPLLRQRLTTLLEQVWPELRVVHQARNGREAIEMMANEPVQVVFLDVHMPGIQGAGVMTATTRSSPVLRARVTARCMTSSARSLTG